MMISIKKPQNRTEATNAIYNWLPRKDGDV